MTTETQAPEGGELPPLPDTSYKLFYEDEGDEDHGDEGYQEVLDEPGYTAKEMRDYARAALAAQPQRDSLRAERDQLLEQLAAAQREVIELRAGRQAPAEGDRQWNIPGSTHPERLFAEWLNDQRMKSVSEVFHDIVRRYCEALDSKAQPKGTAEPFVTSDMLRAALDDLKANHQVVPSMRAMSSALHAALAAAPTETPTQEPDAWQERQEVRPGVFGEWYDRRIPWGLNRPQEMDSGGIRYQFRPLYARPAQAPAPAPGKPAAWTLRETLDKGETTTTGYLWFTDPKNSGWVPLYTEPVQAPAVKAEPAGWRIAKDERSIAGVRLKRHSDGSFTAETEDRWMSVDPRDDAEENYAGELVSVLDALWLAAAPESDVPVQHTASQQGEN